VLYLGANVPLKDVSYVVEQKAPDYLYLHLSSFPVKQSFTKYIQALSERPQCAYPAFRRLAEEHKKPLPQNIQPNC
jgi:hypothetical protein